MENYAPILIPTLNRYDHFRNCVESLKECENASKTDLIISIDYPLKEIHFEGYEKILSYVKTIDGFNRVIIIRRECNFGAIRNIYDSIAEVFEKYDSLILSEDDNVFSVDFLAFVNNGLKVFKDREEIFSISGYQYPVNIPQSYEHNIYVWKGFSAWGVGIWKAKWKKIDWNYASASEKIRKILKNYKDVYKLNKVANHYPIALLTILKNKELHGDGYISAHLSINDMYSVFPTISRVRNMGHDGSGIHCGKMEDDVYSKQIIYEGKEKYKDNINIKPDKNLNKILKYYFRSSSKSKIKTVTKLFLLNVGLYNTLHTIKII